MTQKLRFIINQIPLDCRRELEGLKSMGFNVDGIWAKRLARAEIRGYLNAMEDLGKISDTDHNLLYDYYTEFMKEE